MNLENYLCYEYSIYALVVSMFSVIDVETKYNYFELYDGIKSSLSVSTPVLIDHLPPKHDLNVSINGKQYIGKVNWINLGVMLL
jgi:hypothetical protein